MRDIHKATNSITNTRGHNHNTSRDISPGTVIIILGDTATMAEAEAEAGVTNQAILAMQPVQCHQETALVTIVASMDTSNESVENSATTIETDKRDRGTQETETRALRMQGEATKGILDDSD
jgi:hypothetical protein